MLKKLLVGAILLSTSLLSQAGIISLINGADMAGIQVTATFGDGSQETQVWNATSINSGAAISSDWSLSLSGETFGDLTPLGVLKGLWVLDNLGRSDGIVGLTINGAIANIYFDIKDSVELTPGSSFGRPFATANSNVTESFTNAYSSTDLFGTLNINWAANTFLDLGETLGFLTDTDKVTVSEPATALVFLTGLLALVNIRRKS